MERHIYGPPGTGKTTTLLKLLARESEGGSIEMTDCAATSFSKTAVEHLASNAAQYFAEAEESIRTLNSFGKRAIETDRGGLAIPLVEGLANDSDKARSWMKFHGKLVIDFEALNSNANSGDEDDYGYKPAKSKEDMAVGSRILLEYNAMRQRCKPLTASTDTYAKGLAARHNFVEDYEKWKVQENLIDFVDQLEITLREKLPPPYHVPKLYIDEAQDLSPLMLALVRMWRDEWGTELIMAGDDDQSINSQLNGADPAIWIDPTQVDTSLVLPQSYRVSIEVHELADALISQVGIRVPKDWAPADHHGTVSILPYNVGYRDAKEYGAFRPARFGDGIPNDNAVKLATEVGNLEGNKRTVMVLATCSYMLTGILRELKARGILFHNPYRRARSDWNPLGGGRGTSTLSKYLYMEEKGLTWRSLVYLSSLIKNPVNTGLFYSASGIAVHVKGWTPVQLDTPLTQEEADKNFRPIAFAKFAENPLQYLLDNAQTTKVSSLTYASKVVARYGLDEIPAEPSVIIGTIFSVKGGEADDVFIAPDMSPAAMASMEDEPDTTHRLFYVAVTRAKYNVSILQTVSRNETYMPLIQGVE